MSYTKRHFVEAAFEEAGLASYIFSLTPSQLQTALRRLDGMMATWDGRGIRIGWPLTTDPDNSDLDTETFAPASSQEAIYLNLAPRLAPIFGKTLSNDTQKNARQAYNELLARHTQPPSKNLPTSLARGAGNKPWRYTRNNFISPPDPTLDTAFDGKIDLD